MKETLENKYLNLLVIPTNSAMTQTNYSSETANNDMLRQYSH